MSLLDKIRQHKAHITVIGLGYVGLPLLVEVAKAGFQVTGYDKNYSRVLDVQQREFIYSRCEFC
jgi:UDP-N-acetyl-D-glucosamine dehydrogenase